MVSFGKKIKELRIAHDMKQKELAAALHVSVGTVGMYETNRINPSHDVLLKIANIFDVSMEELYEADIHFPAKPIRMTKEADRVLTDIGKRIYKLRKQEGYTQEKVAAFLGIDRSNYSKYERNKLTLSPELIVRLATLYEVSSDYLLGLKN